MGLLGDLIVRIKGDTGQLVSGLKSADKQVTKFARFVMSGAGIGGAILVFRQLGKMVGDVVKIIGEQEEAEGKLRSAIRATGKEASISVASIAGLANQLQRTTIYGDEATLSAAAMLQQLGNLDEQGLKVLIPRVQNFAAAMGLDLQQAASLVGKTLGSTTNALGRYGIQIDMSKDKSGKLSQLVEQLDGKFAGMAETIGQTTSGKLKILQNQFNDLKQDLAMNLLPTINQVLSGLNQMLGAVTSFRSAKEIMSPAGFQAAISSIGSAQNAMQVLQEEVKRTEELLQTQGRYQGPERERLRRTKERILMLQQVMPLLEIQKNAEVKAAEAVQAGTDAVEDHAEAVERLDVDLQQFIADQTQVVAGFPPVTMGFLGLTDAYNQFVDELVAREPEVQDTFGAEIAAINETAAKEREVLLQRAIANRDFNNAQNEANNENRQKEEEAERAHQENMKTIRQGMYNTVVALIGSLATINSNYYARLLDDETLTDKERKKLQRAQAKSAKNFSLFGAAITGAEAIISGFASKPFLPVGLAMGALATILTGAQIAAITSQPLPKLARGGKLMRPTLFMGGEAGPEWVVPDLKMDELGGRIAEAMRSATINNTIMNDQPILLSVSLDGRQLDAHVQRSIGDRRIVVDKGAVR